jgi:hypothetical protein
VSRYYRQISEAEDEDDVFQAKDTFSLRHDGPENR